MDKIFNKPFAINGARVAIPENGTENERVSFDKGFTQPYEVEAPSVDNPSGQGFNILRPEMNEALYQLSSACNFLAENIDKWVALTNENLNNITQKGRYFQANQSLATNANNYPSEQVGYLIVFDSINNNVTQFYIEANSNIIFSRYSNGGVWSDWDSLVLAAEFNSQINNLNNNKEDKTKFTNGIINNTTNSNLNNLTQNGFYWREPAEGSPLPVTYGGAVIVNTNGRQVLQYFYTDIWDIDDGGAWFRMRNASGVWTSWHHIENSEHTQEQIVTGGVSRSNYTPGNVANATLPIPNKSGISSCTILVTCKYNASTNGAINSNFTFKIDGASVGSVNITKNGVQGEGIGTYYASRQTSFGLSGKLGKTIIPSLTDTGNIKLIDFSFLAIWS